MTILFSTNGSSFSKSTLHIRCEAKPRKLLTTRLSGLVTDDLNEIVTITATYQRQQQHLSYLGLFQQKYHQLV